MTLDLSEKIIKDALHSHENGENCFACPLLCVSKSECYNELRRNAREKGIALEGKKNGS